VVGQSCRPGPRLTFLMPSRPVRRFGTRPPSARSQKGWIFFMKGVQSKVAWGTRRAGRNG